MPVGRRLASLLIVLGLVALPAVVLRAFCLGRSCASSEAATSAPAPFCPLPGDLRAAIAAGFREDRSPDALGVPATPDTGVATSMGDDVEVPWPSLEDGGATRVPIAFMGAGFTGARPAAGTGLDQIAPTLAEAIGYRRPHPEVRSGVAAPGVARKSSTPASAPVVVVIAWKGVGSAALEARPDAWPFLRSMVRASGTLEGTTGSLPLDPAATLTTIGTGGLPSEHGIIGTVLRGERGAIVRAWAPKAPGSVIATLADDLDASTRQRARVGAVLSDRTDRGLVGDGWYLEGRDRDDVTFSDRPVPGVEALLRKGYGTDGDPAFVGVVVRGSIPAMDRTTRRLVNVVLSRAPRAGVVVTATGGPAGPAATDAEAVAAQVERDLGAPIVAARGGGGLFLDRAVSVRRSITADGVATAMAGARSPDGSPVFADTFPSFAVAFSRYC